MNFFSFMLEDKGSPWGTVGTIALLVGVVVIFYFVMIRPQKKQEKAANEMRENLRVGDEVTTIGGIVGKVVSVREETVVLETTKDKTHIRFLRAAIRSVDVRAEDSVDPARQENTDMDKKGKKKKPAIEQAEAKDLVESEVSAEETSSEEAPAEETPAEEKPGKKKKKNKKAKAAVEEAVAEEAPAVTIEEVVATEVNPEEVAPVTPEEAPAVTIEEVVETEIHPESND